MMLGSNKEKRSTGEKESDKEEHKIAKRKRRKIQRKEQTALSVPNSLDFLVKKI